MNISGSDKRWLTVIVLALHVLYLTAFLFLIQSISSLSTLPSLLLIFSCALLYGKWAGFLSGLVVAAFQTGYILYSTGPIPVPSGLAGRLDLLNCALLPLIGLLAGITAEKFSIRNRKLADHVRSLDETNATLVRHLDRYDEAFQDLSLEKVYSRSWDSWTEKDPFGEQIAGVLLSVALIKPPAEKPSRSMTSVHVPEGTAAGVNLSMLMFAMRPDILAILELDGRIVCCNPLLTAILGIDGNDQTGKEISGLLPADDAARVRRNIAGTLKSELDSHERYDIMSADNGFDRILICPQVSLECAGSPIMLIARIADTTLRFAEYGSEGAAEVKSGLSGLASCDLCCIDPDGTITYITNRIAKKISETPESMLHQKLGKFVSKQMAREYRNFISGLSTGACVSADIEMRPCEGRRTIFHLDAYPATGRSGRLLGATILLADVTDVNMIEETLQHRLSMEKLISGISTRFISMGVENLDNEIRQVLQRICEVEDVEEASVEIYQSGRIRNHAKYQVQRHLDPDDRVPDSASMETIAIPVVVESDKLGFFQFSQKKFSNSWFESDLEMIRLIGEIIINALIRKESELSILLNETRLLTTLHSIGDAVISTDNDGQVVMMNNMAEMLTGWTWDQAKNRILGEVFHPYKETLPEAEGLSGDDYAHAMPGPIESLMLLSRSGETYYISLTRNPISDASHGLFGEVIVFRDITREKQESDKILYISFHDKLTGLFNRAYFEEEMVRLNTPRQYPITILLGDCNGLKITNDLFGHLEGDRLLQTIAAILKKSTRHEDIVARWGGDEFAIILPRTDEQSAGQIRDRILQLCSETPGDPLQPSLALGCATNSDGSDDLVSLLKLAEDRMYRHKLTEGKSARNSILLSIEKMLYEKSCETEEHATRIALISHKVGQALGLDDYEMEELGLLSKLHDMGKIGIPDNILLKPGKLDDREWELMKKHSEKGYELAKSTPELNNIADLILHHHERWDGGGYPSGLQGDDIPKLSRVLSIIDAYDVITHSRAYKPIQSKQEALQEIEKCAGKQFDPEISRIFIDIMKNANDTDLSTVSRRD